MFEVHGDPPIHGALHLSKPPVEGIGVAHKLPWLKKIRNRVHRGPLGVTMTDLSTHIASRICHDLISPMGAVDNGLELLGMTLDANSPELALMRDAVAAANARIKFFRIAFGAASAAQAMRPSEIAPLAAEVIGTPRLTLNWAQDADLPRPQVKLGALLALCGEKALPRGGTLNVTSVGTGWVVSAQSDRLAVEPSRFDWLRGTGSELPPPAEVQFPLAAALATELGVTLTVTEEPETLTLSAT